MNGCTETAKPRVQILLSTYNGEKYLRQQLDSFVAQTWYPNLRVLIRDDGSMDGTRFILKDYAKQYGFEVLYGENIGVSASYDALLRASDSTCDYFAFSDQDDVWLPEKLELAIERLSEQRNNVPALFFSLSQITDERLNPVAVSHSPVRGVSFYNAMVQNVAPGHTQVFNRELRNRLLRHECTHAHVVDWWVYLLATGTGNAVFVPRCTVLHRQHGRNAVGYETNILKQFMTRIKRVRSKEAAAITRQLEYFLQDYGKDLPESYRTEVQLFLNSQQSIVYRFLYVIRAKIFRQTWVETMLVSLLYLFGKYKLKD